MNTDKQVNGLPNFTRRMLWVFLAQMLLVAVLFVWNEFFPAWLNQVIVTSSIFFVPLAYLTVLTRPSLRQAWRNVLADSWALLVSMVVAFFRLFSPATAMKLVRCVTSLKPVPTTVDEWVTLCVLLFKICIVATIPMIWIFEKIVSHSTHFRSYGRTSGLSYELLLQCYLISLLALLLGAMVQGVFCRTGRATTTLRFFLLGVVLLFLFVPRFLAA